jgi:hypothetical protein
MTYLYWPVCGFKMCMGRSWHRFFRQWHRSTSCMELDFIIVRYSFLFNQWIDSLSESSKPFHGRYADWVWRLRPYCRGDEECKVVLGFPNVDYMC